MHFLLPGFRKVSKHLHVYKYSHSKSFQIQLGDWNKKHLKNVSPFLNRFFCVWNYSHSPFFISPCTFFLDSIPGSTRKRAPNLRTLNLKIAWKCNLQWWGDVIIFRSYKSHSDIALTYNVWNWCRTAFCMKKCFLPEMMGYLLNSCNCFLACMASSVIATTNSDLMAFYYDYYLWL